MHNHKIEFSKYGKKNKDQDFFSKTFFLVFFNSILHFFLEFFDKFIFFSQKVLTFFNKVNKRIYNINGKLHKLSSKLFFTNYRYLSLFLEYIGNQHWWKVEISFFYIQTRFVAKFTPPAISTWPRSTINYNIKKYKQFRNGNSLPSSTTD